MGTPGLHFAEVQFRTSAPESRPFKAKGVYQVLVRMSDAGSGAPDGPAQKRSRLDSGAAEQREADGSGGSSVGGDLSRHMSSVVRQHRRAAADSWAHIRSPACVSVGTDRGDIRQPELPAALADEPTAHT